MEENGQTSFSGRALPAALPSTACVRMHKGSRAKRGKEERLLASFAGQIIAFLKMGEWVQKRKCASGAARQMLRLCCAGALGWPWTPMVV